MSIQEVIAGLPVPPPLALEGAALFLDLDGTLAPIAARPQDVGPDPRRTSLLERLAAQLDGRLAIISGRTLADVDRIVEARVPAVAAVHGLVLRDGYGAVTQSSPHPALAQATTELRAFARRDLGLLVEEKGGLSVALHFRLARDQAGAARACAADIARRTGLALQDGEMVAELRTPGPCKGDSVRAFMASSPFAGARPVFVGDDVTDEDGFQAAQALGGAGVRVGGSHPTIARFGLASVAQALDWLEAAR